MSRERKGSGKFAIREAVEADLPVLVEFLAKLALHVASAPPQTLKAKEHSRLIAALESSLADENTLLVVAEAGDAGLVGMGDIRIWQSKGIWEQAGEIELKSGVIDDVWVEPDYRNLGIFKALLKKLVAFAEERGAYELILEYSESNTEAKTAWTRLGFKTTGVRAAAFTTAVRSALIP